MHIKIDNFIRNQILNNEVRFHFNGFVDRQCEILFPFVENDHSSSFFRKYEDGAVETVNAKN